MASPSPSQAEGILAAPGPEAPASHAAIPKPALASSLYSVTVPKAANVQTGPPTHSRIALVTAADQSPDYLRPGQALAPIPEHPLGSAAPAQAPASAAAETAAGLSRTKMQPTAPAASLRNQPGGTAGINTAAGASTAALHAPQQEAVSGTKPVPRSSLGAAAQNSADDADQGPKSGSNQGISADTAAGAARPPSGSVTDIDAGAAASAAGPQVAAAEDADDDDLFLEQIRSLRQAAEEAAADEEGEDQAVLSAAAAAKAGSSLPKFGPKGFPSILPLALDAFQPQTHTPADSPLIAPHSSTSSASLTHPAAAATAKMTHSQQSAAAAKAFGVPPLEQQFARQRSVSPGLTPANSVLLSPGAVKTGMLHLMLYPCAGTAAFAVITQGLF